MTTDLSGVDQPRETLDLTNCDREPIHIPGRIQSFGYLIAVSTDWTISHVSANVGELLGVSPTQLVGAALVRFVRTEALHDIRSRVQMLVGRDAVERMFGIQVVEGDDPFDVAVHVSADTIIIEMERHGGSEEHERTRYVQPMVERIGQTGTVRQLCEVATRHLKVLTGFDRVMAYRFAPDDTGEVVAEAKRADLEVFLGLRYPAADIPRQARELYRRNLLRIISDIDDPGVGIIAGPGGQPLDLSMSTTRAVSPIHIEYLRNMGVGASMSVSIIKRGKLWGLFACHHYSPRILTYELRSAVELFGQLFSFVLDQKETDAERRGATRARQLNEELMERQADGNSIQSQFPAIVESIGSVIPCDGAICWMDGQFSALGHAPDRAEFGDLLQYINSQAVGVVSHSDNLSSVFPPAQPYAGRAAGLLVLPVSRNSRDCIVLFRQELVRTVSWAGRPEKVAEYGPNGPRLTPRKSFEAWQETVRGRCAPWTESEIAAAESLRLTLLEIVLRATDLSMSERALLLERQEVLIAELNHRVRNILNLIRGLLSQSSKDAIDVATFIEIMGGRVQALARAHDQITRQHWSPASLKTMIATEVAAYLASHTDRISVAGPDAMLEPNAFVTVSLVIHEMITNAAKYGALSNCHGSIDIVLNLEDDGSLLVDWRERGGPEVQRPTRRGFGTTIIERSIPHELRGTAFIRYESQGVQATFGLPAHLVSPFVEPTGIPEPAKVEQMTSRLKGCVLVVEDNMIIALDAEEQLRDLGVENTVLAGSVAEALDIIAERDDLSFALVDVNLGRETSEPVARALVDAGIGFMFSTGYGDAAGLLDGFPGVPVLQKPYTAAVLRSHLLGADG